MVYYLLATLSLLFPKIISDKKIYFIFMFGMMALVSGLRGINVGSDTITYHELFYARENITLNDWWGETNFANEPGIWLLIKLSYFMFNDAQGFIFITSIITYYFLGNFIYKNTNDNNYGIAVFMVFAVGFFMYQMNAMRQALGIAIASNFFTYSKNDKYKNAFLIVMIASLMHYSMLVLIPIIILLKIFYKKNIEPLDRIKVVLGICVIMIGCIIGVLNYISNNLDLLLVSYQYYFDINNIRSAEGNAGMYLIGWSMIYGLLIAYTNFMEVRFEYKTKLLLESILLSLAIVFTVMVMTTMQIFYRFIDTFSIYVCLLIPDFLENVKPNYMRPLAFVIVVIFGYISIWYILLKGFNGVSEYELFL